MSHKSENGSVPLSNAVKVLAGAIVGIGAIAAPFIATGEFKQRMKNLESRADAAEIELRTHEDRDTADEIALARTLGSIETKLDNQTALISSTQEQIKALWKYRQGSINQ